MVRLEKFSPGQTVSDGRLVGTVVGRPHVAADSSIRAGRTVIPVKWNGMPQNGVENVQPLWILPMGFRAIGELLDQAVDAIWN